MKTKNTLLAILAFSTFSIAAKADVITGFLSRPPSCGFPCRFVPSSLNVDGFTLVIPDVPAPNSEPSLAAQVDRLIGHNVMVMGTKESSSLFLVEAIQEVGQDITPEDEPSHP